MSMAAKYGINIYEALVNAVAANVVLTLRSKRMPGLDTMVKFGLEKALINTAGSFIASYMPIEGVNPLDLEYLSTALAAGISSYWKPGVTASYLAMEQMLISLVSHLITTKTMNSASPYLQDKLGDIGIDKLNVSAPLY